MALAACCARPRSPTTWSLGSARAPDVLAPASRCGSATDTPAVDVRHPRSGVRGPRSRATGQAHRRSPPGPRPVVGADDPSSHASGGSLRYQRLWTARRPRGPIPGVGREVSRAVGAPGTVRRGGVSASPCRRSGRHRPREATWTSNTPSHRTWPPAFDSPSSTTAWPLCSRRPSARSSAWTSWTGATRGRGTSRRAHRDGRTPQRALRGEQVRARAHGAARGRSAARDLLSRPRQRWPRLTGTRRPRGVRPAPRAPARGPSPD